MKMKIQKSAQLRVNVPRLLWGAIIVYILLVVLVHWLMGDQLLFRQSRGNFE